MQLPRPRIQRAFVLWFNEHRKRFVVPVRLVGCTRNGIKIDMPGFGGAVRGFLNSYAIDVSVTWQGEIIDLLQSFEAMPRRMGNGYRCDLCLPEHVRIFHDRESSWRDLLFEPFLEWVNTEYSAAQRLDLYRIKGGTWAELVVKDTEIGDHCIASIRVTERAGREAMMRHELSH